MPPRKKIPPADKEFLKTAAEAIGAAIGKLAVKTGIVAPVAAPPSRRKALPARKRRVSVKVAAAKPRAKKPAKRSGR